VHHMRHISGCCGLCIGTQYCYEQGKYGMIYIVTQMPL
jgi:hypothetical protein